MNVVELRQHSKSLEVVWSDESTSAFPYIWLRDNDPRELHPQTRERLFDLTTVDVSIRPHSCNLAGQHLVIQWPDKNAASSYPVTWLASHGPGCRRPDPAQVSQYWWDTSDEIPTLTSRSCNEPEGLLYALKQLKRFGLIILQGLGEDVSAGEQFGEAIGFKRTTNFGTMFEVISKPDPNNLAYTSIELPLHTDLPNQALIPGFQFLHCLRNDASGGESTFADGFRVCDSFRNAHPDHFQCLCEHAIPFRFHDQRSDIRYRRPVIEVTPEGQVDRLAFNAHIADIPDLPAEVLGPWYTAYQTLMKSIRDPLFAQHFRLQPGEMVVFDNRRVLHGRRAFDPQSGSRHLRGYYIDANELDSTIRVLARRNSSCPEYPESGQGLGDVH